MTAIPARPSVERHPVHPSITRQQISDLVEGFYGEVMADQRLAPIFANNVEGEWIAHLEKMKAFWRSVLLRTGEYRGKPVPAHQKIDNVDTEDFERWLTLFSRKCSQVFEPEAAELVLDAARRIASSLWLARSNDPFASPPNWSCDQPLPGIHPQ